MFVIKRENGTLLDGSYQTYEAAEDRLLELAAYCGNASFVNNGMRYSDDGKSYTYTIEERK